MTTQLPSRHQVDRAAPLRFDGRAPQAAPAAEAAPQVAEKQANITIEVAPDGLHITAEYTGTLSSIPAAIERLKAAGVLELVKASAPAPTANPAPSPTLGATKARVERTAPSYNGEGDACCPVHRRKLSEGDYGLFCSAKAKDGQIADKKGYCGLKFEE